MIPKKIDSGQGIPSPHGGDAPPPHVAGCLHWGLGSVVPASHAGGLPRQHMAERAPSPQPRHPYPGGKADHISYSHM